MLLSFRSVLVAVFVAALLTALTASASPFVTTAAGSEALKNRLAELTPLATGLQIDGGLSLPSSPELGVRRDAAEQVAAAKLAHSMSGVGSPVLTTETSTLYAIGSSGDNPVRLMTRTGALAHVKILAQTKGPGVWIASLTAQLGHLKPGDLLHFNGSSTGGSGHATLRIKGIYRALSHSPQTPYWVHFFEDIYPATPDDSPPPSYVFVGMRDLFTVLEKTGAGAFGAQAPGSIGASSGQARTMVEFPVNPKGLTLAGARSLERRFERVERALPASALARDLGCAGRFTSPCITTSSLSAAVELADGNVAAVSVPISLLADAGTLIALAVAAAAGAFLVRRRRAEAAFAYARGEHVAVFAGRTAVEAVGPAVAGGGVGFGLAYALTGALAPAGSTDPATVATAAWHGAVAVGVALALTVVVAAVAFTRLFDTGAGSRRWPRAVPWELPALGVAIYLLVQITSGRGLSGSSGAGAAHPTLAVFVFPLLAVAAVAGLAARAGRLALRLVSSRAAGTSIPVYLALRRLAAARGMLVVLSVVTAVSLGAFAYSEALASSLRHTTTEKAYMATGSDAQAWVEPGQKVPPGFPYPVTEVQFANQAATLNTTDGVAADVMLVDPSTVAGALHWESDWGPNPGTLVQRIEGSPSWPLPVVVTADATSTRAFWASGIRFPVNVVGVVKAFPEMSAGIPLVITSQRALDQASTRVKLGDPLGVLETSLWGKGPPLQVERALSSSSLDTYYASSIDTFLHDPSVLLATHTYSFMQTVALAAAVLVLLGLLLYLQARQRSQVIASALARRMGLGPRTEAMSLTLELGAILGFAALVGFGVAIAVAAPVVRHIDPLPQDAPGPIFVVPRWELAIAAACLVLVAVLAGALTTWLAGRADVSEELRVA